MHPAVSVIIFTVTSGAGFGLIFLLGLGVPVPAGQGVALFLSIAALGLSSVGLIASTFHLGHPERAWRAFSQWRSSWLSREGVLSVAALGFFTLYAANWIFNGERSSLLGPIAGLLAIATVFATSMIYAQLRTVPSWATRWTTVCFIGFSIASAALLIGGTAAEEWTRAYTNIAGGALLMTWAAKMKWWQRVDGEQLEDAGSTTGTATGLEHLGDVHLLERPHSGENYLTREMVHQIGRKHAQKLRNIALIVGGVVPFSLCVAASRFGFPNEVLFIAFIAMMIGLFAERWLFFAEAKHSVSLYY